MENVMEKNAVAGISAGTNKFLTFMLGEEEYGLEIMKVREIIGMMQITRVPKMPEFVRGVINLRGKVIPVVNLREKFLMQAIEDTAESCIIVIDMGAVLMGIIVDKVLEVLNIDGSEVDAAPSFGVTVDTDFILGVGKTKGKVVLLLDIYKVLTTDELAEISSAGVGN